MRRRLAAVAVCMLALAACGDDTAASRDTENAPVHRIVGSHVEFDGVRYRCLVYDDRSAEQGGLWCERDSDERNSYR